MSCDYCSGDHASCDCHIALQEEYNKQLEREYEEQLAREYEKQFEEEEKNARSPYSR